MKFESMIIKNFRNFEDIELNLSNQNIFFGLNTRAKSNPVIVKLSNYNANCFQTYLANIFAKSGLSRNDVLIQKLAYRLDTMK